MEINDASIAFAALSSPVRFAVLRHLIASGPQGETAGALATHLATPAPTLSFHLKELQHAGLIQSRKEGRFVIYAANYGGIRAAIDFLLTDCCQGDPRLCGPYVVPSRNIE